MFTINKADKQLLKFTKIQLEKVSNSKSKKDIDLFQYNQCIINIIEQFQNINDPIILNVLAAKLHNLRPIVGRNGIDCREFVQTIDSYLALEDEENVNNSNYISIILSEILQIRNIQVPDMKLEGLVLQRIVYLMTWIPLQTFKNIEELELKYVGGTKESPIMQSSIAGMVYQFEAFSDKAYISNGILFQALKEDGSFEPYICDESRLFVKYPLKSSDFIPVIIRIDLEGKVFKLDRAKYKKLKKRILSNTPRFLNKNDH